METDEAKKEVNLDSILEILGPYGRYNIMNFVLLLFPVILSGLFECGYMFEAQAITYRCEVNGCENTFNDTSWIQYAIPKKEDGGIEYCLKYATESDQTIQQCIPEEFNPNKTVSCDKYVYESKGFLVEDFDLGCQEWKRTLVGTVHNFGMFVALVLTGALSDRYGRKRAVGLASTACLIFGIARAFTPNYLSYLAMHFLEAGFGGGLYPSSYVLAVELVGLKQRVFVSAMCNMAFVVGEVILAVLAMFVTNWRTYVIILYAPAVIVSIYVWFMNESARWLLSKGRKEEAIQALKRAAKINKMDPKKLELNSLTDPLLKSDSQQTDKKSQLFLALHSSIIWKRVLICSFLWITCSLVYYGMSINAVSLSGGSDDNKYLNYIFVVLVEIPAYVVVVIVLDKYGRKKTMITCFVICAVTSILFAVLSKGAWWSIVLYLIGKWSVTLAYSSVYIYVSEVFPTNMRQTLISVCSTSGRVGSLIAPMTPLLPMPTLIFGGMCIASSCFVILLPETKNIRMPDTIQESEDLSRVKKKHTVDLDMT